MNNLFLLSGCLALGLLAGWMSVRHEAPHAPSEAASSPTEPTAPRGWDPGRFIDEATAKAGQMDRSEGSNKLLASLTGEEVAGAMNEAVAAPDFLVRELGATWSIFQEFLKRDFDAGFKWFESLPYEQRAKLAKGMAEGWPEDRIREGIDYLLTERPPSDARGGNWSPLVAKALKFASEQSPEDFAALLSNLQGAGFEWQLPYTFSFGADFDFAGLLESETFGALQNDSAKERVMDAWARNDRDSAFSWIMENRGPQDLKAFMGHDPNRPASLQAETRKWLGSRLDGLQPEERSAFLEKLTEGLVIRSDRGVSALLSGMKDPHGRFQVFNHFTQPIYSGGVDVVIRLMEGLPDKNETLDLLEKVQPDPAEVGRKGRNALTQAEQARLRSKLLEWGTDESRADLLIQRFQSE